MKRRKFIRGSLIAGSLSFIGLGGYKAYSIFRHPDFDYLIQHKAFIAEICETLIPQTDTPGAKDAQVEDFVIYCVQHIITSKEANTFIDGLKCIEDYCKDNFKSDYVECNL